MKLGRLRGEAVMGRGMAWPALAAARIVSGTPPSAVSKLPITEWHSSVRDQKPRVKPVAPTFAGGVGVGNVRSATRHVF